MTEPSMVECVLGRIVIRDGSDRQYIYLEEREGSRGFPIVIGNNEAGEIHRVIHGHQTERPLTHQLALESIQALGSSLISVDIVDLRQNTFFAHVVLKQGNSATRVDARPSDAIALALRARCRIRVAESVLRKASEPDTSL